MSGANSPHYQIIRWETVKVSDSYILARKRWISAGAWDGKNELHSKGRRAPRRRVK